MAKDNSTPFVVVRAGPANTKGLAKDEQRVALWEPDQPMHPRTQEFPNGGEAFVAGPNARLVAKTPEVVLRIRDERLEELTGKDAENLKFAPVGPDGTTVVDVGKATSPSIESATGAAPTEG